MFALYYSAAEKKVRGLNGSGRAASKATLDQIRKAIGLSPDQRGTIPLFSVHTVTTPGAAAGWVDVIEKFGSGTLSLRQILEPAIELAEQGFPVSELSSSSVRDNACAGNREKGFTWH
jgi:gamma-glutamyltranspeptidase/glutathione hydrolase